MTIDDYGELLAIPNVIGVKYSDTNLSRLTKLKELYPDKVFFGGADDMLLQFIISGADGAIGSTYSLLGKQAKALFDAIQNSDLKKAQSLQLEMNQVIAKMENIGVYQTLKLY